MSFHSATTKPADHPYRAVSTRIEQLSRRSMLHRQYPTEHIITRPSQPDRTTELIPQDSKTPAHISHPAIPAAPSLPRMATPASIDSTGLRSTPTITVTRHGLIRIPLHRRATTRLRPPTYDLGHKSQRMIPLNTRYPQSQTTCIDTPVTI